MAASSSSVAARSVAASPMTQVRMDECPAKVATLGTTPRCARASRYSGTVSKFHCVPASRASSAMPSTCVRLRRVRSRSAGRQGAMVKPQLPITTVVTPSPTEGLAVGSQVICAS